MLLVALIFLILLTLLAIGASSGSLLQQRMVAATRNAQLATMSADTTLRGAEWNIWSTASVVGGNLTCLSNAISSVTGCVKFDTSSALYGTGTDAYVTQFRTDDNKWLSGIGITYKNADGQGFTTGYKTADLAQNPQYIIEDMGQVRPPGAGPQHESGVTGPNNAGAGQINIHIFRVTARATGGNKNTVRVTQSTFDAQATN